MPGVGFKARLLIHFLRLSKEYKASLITSPIALLLFVIGFATPYWVAGSYKVVVDIEVNSGLWEKCLAGNCFAPSNEDWLDASRAMACLGLLCAIITVVLAALYVCVSRFDKPAVPFAQGALHLAAALFVLIGDIVFAVHAVDKDIMISWSIILTMLMIVLEIVSGILVILHARKSDSGLPSLP
ncbi:lens fiber membrane intrinsic protein [Lingula anatina]|uniref:Lens fiber membrane intrinsic protein n=1 Tax=Lingula anatina TaxID=7574 RepID=A0A1S3IGX9_LINAN|nr:lens fiber membrane intrinsic protein [Lingula anatina]|eukprot:XP_013397472.1 lens fiber membrane intrinsic protein [Lingula anatina]